jgi:translation elongation factor EF-Ts
LTPPPKTAIILTKPQKIMTIITAKLLKRLVWETAVNKIYCVRALKNSNGDIGEAIKWLRNKGIYN